MPGTEAKRYGFALDRKFSRQFFGGIEVTKRDLSVPLMFTDLTAIPVPVTSVRYADWQEDSARGYVFLTPSDRLALSLEYQYQLLDRRFSPATGVEAIDEIKVHKVPLSLRFFLDSAWTFAVKGTYVKETYDSGFEGSVTEHDSDFWLADAIVSYRLPKRRGLAAIGATNLFDKQFAYQQVDSANTEFLPVRMLFGRVTLYFP